MGRTASGVRGIRLKGKDHLVSMDLVDAELAKKKMLELLIITEEGFGKRSNLDEYRIQGRGGSGIKTAAISKKSGNVVQAHVAMKDTDQDLLVISNAGQVIRFSYQTVRVAGRATLGVRCMRFKEDGDKVISATLV
jgi:DNA gyrase subunit A